MARGTKQRRLRCPRGERVQSGHGGSLALRATPLGEVERHWAEVGQRRQIVLVKVRRALNSASEQATGTPTAAAPGDLEMEHRELRRRTEQLEHDTQPHQRRQPDEPYGQGPLMPLREPSCTSRLRGR